MEKKKATNAEPSSGTQLPDKGASELELATETRFTDLTSGDQAACEDFVREHYAGVFRWFMWLTSDQEKAADLTQDTFAGFWHSIQQKIPEAAPKVWLFAIGRNLWRKHCRNKKRREKEEGPAPLDYVEGNDPEPSRVAEQADLARRIEAEVAELPDDYREAFTLRLWQDFDYDEIAEVQGITRDLARWRYFRARQMIRSRVKSLELEEEHHGS